MTDFLEKLYSIENFGIYLFVVIGILIVLFLIILFFGKKDAKKRKELEKEKKDTVKEESTPLFQEAGEQVKVEAPVVTPPAVEEDPLSTVNQVLNENNFVETQVTNEVLNENLTVEPEIPKEEKEFDFDALAAAISKELESIEKTEEVNPIKEEKPVLPKEEEAPLRYQVFEPVQEKNSENHVAIPETSQTVVKEENVEPVKPKPVMPKVFSSVYVNRDLEEPKVTEGVKVSEPEVVTPVAPKIELPKIMDLPKKNDDVFNDSSDDIIFK